MKDSTFEIKHLSYNHYVLKSGKHKLQQLILLVVMNIMGKHKVTNIIVNGLGLSI